jgi:hypothetical protein
MARLAICLATLRAQFDACFPGRSKVSDGWIGDVRHAQRQSFHNPDANGVVRALDVTHDPTHGVDIDVVTDQLVTSHDYRILELIANGMYWSAKNPHWVPYTGSNPHRKHFHISCVSTVAGGDDSSPWNLAIFAAPSPTPAPSPGGRPTLSAGSSGDLVKSLQAFLNHAFPAYSKLVADGAYGPATKGVVAEFQRRAGGLAVDGVVGPQTWIALVRYGFR